MAPKAPATSLRFAYARPPEPHMSRSILLSLACVAAALAPQVARAESGCTPWETSPTATMQLSAAQCSGGYVEKDGSYTLPDGPGGCKITVRGKVALVGDGATDTQRTGSLTVTVADGASLRIADHHDLADINVTMQPGSSPTSVCVERNRLELRDKSIAVSADRGRTKGKVEIRDNLVIGPMWPPGEDGGGAAIDVDANNDARLRRKGAEEQRFAADSVKVMHNAVIASHTGNTESIALNGALTGIDVGYNLVYEYTNIGIDVIGGETKQRGQPDLGVVHHNVVARYIFGENDKLGYAIYTDGGRRLAIVENLTFESAAGIEASIEAARFGKKGAMTVDNVYIARNVIDNPSGACKNYAVSGAPCPKDHWIEPSGVHLGTHSSAAHRSFCLEAEDNYIYGDRPVDERLASQPNQYMTDFIRVDESGEDPRRAAFNTWMLPPEADDLKNAEGDHAHEGLTYQDCAFHALKADESWNVTNGWDQHPNDKGLRESFACSLLLPARDGEPDTQVGPRAFDNDPQLMRAFEDLRKNYGCDTPAPQPSPTP